MNSSEETIPQDKFLCLMNAITGAKKKMEEKLTASINELQQKVEAVSLQLSKEAT